MAEDARNRDTKKKTPPSIELGWDPLVPAPDGTYSTTIRITLRGWWDGGRPKRGKLSITESGGKESDIELRLQDPQTLYARTGLKAGHHYSVEVVTGGESTSRVMVVPTPPKDPPRVLPKLSVEPLGVRPRLRFSIRLALDGRGMAGAVEVTTYSGDAWTIEVNESGSVIWPSSEQPGLRFKEKLKTYRFRVVGADLNDRERACECEVS